MALFLLCLKIFFVRILDVSLGTIRSIMTIKGKIRVASFIGFIEVFVWFVIVREALNTESTSLFIAFAYAAGYASGTFIGGTVSNKLIKMKLGVQVVLSKRDNDIVKAIRDEGFAVSVVEAKGKNFIDTKYMLFIGVDSHRYNELTKLVKTLDKEAFIVVSETKHVHNGYFAK